MSISLTDPAGLLDVDHRLLLERRFLFALSRYESRIIRTEIAFTSDESASESKSASESIGIQCHVTVELQRASLVSLTEKHSDLTKCISRVADRTSRAVSRSIDNAIQREGSHRSSLYTSIHT